MAHLAEYAPTLVPVTIPVISRHYSRADPIENDNRSISTTELLA
jgi:hypothetical protein